MPEPSVSVVVPVFNRTDFLGEALESVLSQNYSGAIEVIVVDDGSDIPVAPRFACDFPRVRFLRQANRGLGEARRTGSLAATGDLLGHLDDDDTWPTNSLRRRAEVFAARTDVHVVAGDIAHFWPHNPVGAAYYRDRFPRLDAAPRQMLPGYSDIWVFERGALVDAILLGLPFFAQSILSRREWFHAIGGWEANSTIFTECYGFCYRATMAGAVAWVDEPVAHVRRGHAQATSDTNLGRLEECKGLADWGRRLSRADLIHVAPRLARRLLVQSFKFGRRGRLLTALEIAGYGVGLASRAPLAFAQRPWRSAKRLPLQHAVGH